MKRVNKASQQWRKQRVYGKNVLFGLLFSTLFVSCGLSPVHNLNIEKDRFERLAFKTSVLKVLNWNIEKKGDREDWHADFAHIADTHAPDLLIFQEAGLNDSLEDLLELHDLGWNFAPNLREDRHGTLSGVLTASQVKPLSRRVLFTEHHEPFAKTQKMSLVTEYRLYGREQSLLVINIHAINFVLSKKFESQIAELEQILEAHQGPMILAGDFNTWSKKRMAHLLLSAERLGLQAVAFQEHDRKRIKNILFSPPFDHIFYRGLSVKNQSPDVLEEISSSDHKPLFVEFVLNGPDEPKT
ncbi:MAG: endonuclease/exonuclease/phosphatase family protein [bacterium]|nr:endonuclease/exonuclease/phosphatase family protein [bacterium]